MALPSTPRGCEAAFAGHPPEQAPKTGFPGLSRTQEEVQPDCAFAARSIGERKPARRAVPSRTLVSVLPGGHDAWVVGDESLVVVDSVGAVVPTVGAFSGDRNRSRRRIGLYTPRP